MIKIEQETAHVFVIDLPTSVSLFLRDDLTTKTKSSYMTNILYEVLCTKYIHVKRKTK